MCIWQNQSRFNKDYEFKLLIRYGGMFVECECFREWDMFCWKKHVLLCNDRNSVVRDSDASFSSKQSLAEYRQLLAESPQIPQQSTFVLACRQVTHWINNWNELLPETFVILTSDSNGQHRLKWDALSWMFCTLLFADKGGEFVIVGVNPWILPTLVSEKSQSPVTPNIFFYIHTCLNFT